MKFILIFILFTGFAFSQVYNVGQTRENVSAALVNALAQPDSNSTYRSELNGKLDVSDSTIYLTPNDAAVAYQPLDADLTDLADGSLTFTKVTGLQDSINLKLDVADSTIYATQTDIVGSSIIGTTGTLDSLITDFWNGDLDSSHYTSISGVINLQDSLTTKLNRSEYTVPTGTLADVQWTVLQGDGNLSEASGLQTWSGSDRTSQDVFTVTANTTYLVEGQWIVNTGATTHTTAIAWSTAATVTRFEYTATLWSAAANTITTTQSTTHVTGVASKVLNATSTAVYTMIQFNGILVIGSTAGGSTITPQINFSANPTGSCLMKAGSYIKITKLGTDTAVESGGWQ